VNLPLASKQTGRPLHTIKDHTKSVNKISFSKDQSHFITASTDHTCKLYDTTSWKLLKSYDTGRPVNAASLSPLHPHVRQMKLVANWSDIKSPRIIDPSWWWSSCFWSDNDACWQQSVQAQNFPQDLRGFFLTKLTKSLLPIRQCSYKRV